MLKSKHVKTMKTLLYEYIEQNKNCFTVPVCIYRFDIFTFNCDRPNDIYWHKNILHLSAKEDIHSNLNFDK